MASKEWEDKNFETAYVDNVSEFFSKRKEINGIDGDDRSKKKKWRGLIDMIIQLTVFVWPSKSTLSEKIDDAEQREELVMQHFLP